MRRNAKKPAKIEKPKSDSILDLMDYAVSVAKEEGVDKTLVKARSELAKIGKMLEIAPLEALLFSCFMEMGNDNSINLEQLADTLGCGNIKILKYANECDALVKKRLVRAGKNRRGSVAYRIPVHVKESIRKDGKVVPEKIDGLTIRKLFHRLNDLFQERNNEELTYADLVSDVKELLEANKQLEFCARVLSVHLDDDDTILLVAACHLFVENDDDNIGYHDICFLYDGDDDCDCLSDCMRDNLKSEDFSLFACKLLQHNNDDGFICEDSFRVSNRAKKELLSEIKTLRGSNKKVMKWEKIKEKKLFYNDKDRASIDELTGLLQEDNYKKVVDRLNTEGMHKGFACLFSGYPGTGKTETAYQIARATGRDLMAVDIAETKSMWYGESEKKIKELFDDYRQAVEDCDKAPILLFNEADAIISSRKSTAGSPNAEIDETENRIQNIILQEIENLDGILIATTNLTGNMDKAFERRFLYKIEFEKPTFDARKSIWLSMIAGLPDSDAGELADSFNMTGGQIENVARKRTVNAVLNGKMPEMAVMKGWCKEELAGSAGKVIGFGT
jgi:hypothetical protein